MSWDAHLFPKHLFKYRSTILSCKIKTTISMHTGPAEKLQAGKRPTYAMSE
jgi:hypothetical protein